jgi:hypothetical protein
LVRKYRRTRIRVSQQEDPKEYHRLYYLTRTKKKSKRGRRK